MAVTVPRFGPELINWALSDEYHNVPGGHIRIYRRSVLDRATRARSGLRVTGHHYAHGLHSPYWWLKCLVGTTNDDHRLVEALPPPARLGHHEGAAADALAERVLAPLMGKSIVVYLREAADVTTTIATVAGVPGLLSAEEIARSREPPRVAAAARAARSRGSTAGTAIPWNHVEAAMALTVTGLRRRGPRRLSLAGASTQLGDGSWFNYYVGERREGRASRHQRVRLRRGRCSTTTSLATDDVDFAARMWPDGRARDRLRAALAARRRHRFAGRSTRSGRRETYALLTGSSSIFHSLRCAVALAERLGFAKPRSGSSRAGRLGHAVAHHPGAFAPKNEFAMDWYYPIFSGALVGERGREAHRRRLGAPRHGRLRRALRVDQRLGDRGRDRRVRARPRRPRAHEPSARPVQLHATPPPRGRRLLDGHRLSRARSRSPIARRRRTRRRPIILAADALTSSSRGVGTLSPRRVADAARPRRTGLPARR